MLYQEGYCLADTQFAESVGQPSKEPAFGNAAGRPQGPCEKKGNLPLPGGDDRSDRSLLCCVVREGNGQRTVTPLPPPGPPRNPMPLGTEWPTPLSA